MINKTNILERLQYHSYDMTQDEDGNMRREVYVLFYDSGAKHWWNRFLKKGFTHCSLVTFDGYEYTLVSHSTGYNYHQALPLPHHTPPHVVREHLSDAWGIKGMTMIKVCCIISNEYRVSMPISMDTCVEDSKKYLGIGNRLILTPHQLYKHLHRTGTIKHEYT